MPRGATDILQRPLWSCWCKSPVLYDDQPADVGSLSSIEPGRLSPKALKQHLQDGRPAPGIVQVGCSLSQASHSTMSDDGGGSDDDTMCLAAYDCGSSCGGGEDEQHDAAVRLIGLKALSPAGGGACSCNDDTTATAAAAESWDCSSPPSPDSPCGGGNSPKQLDGRYFVPFDQLVFHALIGRGSFKAVYRGRWRNTNVAIVRMRRGGLLTEARLMQQLSTHPNLVQFYRWSQDGDGNEYCLMELVALGSLDRLLLQLGELLRTSAKLSMCEQVCAGMAELAAEGVLHRDLAARNVLVQSVDPVHVKVADFGLAANTSQGGGGGCSGMLGIPVRWAAPEVLLCQQWSQASDVWAFGVTAWEIFTNGSEPYANETDKQVVQSVLSGSRLARPSRCPREMYRLMLDCWADDPAQRLSFKDILATFRKWQLEHHQLLEAAQQHSGQLLQQPGTPAFAAAAPISHARSWGPQAAAAAAAQVAAEAARPGLGQALQARAGVAEHRVRFSMDLLLAQAQQRAAAAAGSGSEDSSGRGHGRSSRASELPAGVPRGSGVAPSAPLQQLQLHSSWSQSYSAPLPLYSLNKHVGQLLQRGLVRPGPGCHWTLADAAAAGLMLPGGSSCSASKASAGDADEGGSACKGSSVQQDNAAGASQHQAEQAATAAAAARVPACGLSDARVDLWVTEASGLHEQGSSSAASTPHARSRHAAPWAEPLPAAAWAQLQLQLQLQLQHNHQHAAGEQAALCCSSGSSGPPAALGLCGCQQEERGGSSIDMSFDQEGEIDPNCVESLEGSCVSEDWLPLPLPPPPPQLGLGSCQADAELPAPRTSCQFPSRTGVYAAGGTPARPGQGGPSINEIRPAAPAPVAARHNPYTPVRAVVCGASAPEYLI